MLLDFSGRCPGDPYGIRTRVTSVKGRCPRPLDEGVAGLKEVGVVAAMVRGFNIFS